MLPAAGRGGASHRCRWRRRARRATRYYRHQRGWSVEPLVRALWTAYDQRGRRQRRTPGQQLQHRLTRAAPGGKPARRAAVHPRTRGDAGILGDARANAPRVARSDHRHTGGTLVWALGSHGTERACPLHYHACRIAAACQSHGPRGDGGVQSGANGGRGARCQLAAPYSVRQRDSTGQPSTHVLCRKCHVNRLRRCERQRRDGARGRAGCNELCNRRCSALWRARGRPRCALRADQRICRADGD